MPPSTGPERHYVEEVEEDSHMEYIEHMDDEEALNRAIAESMSQ